MSIDEIRKMYASGKTLREIAKHMGCHHEIVRRQLKMAGADLRTRGVKPNKAKRKKAFELRGQGLTHRQIGEALGVSKNTACYLAERGADDAFMSMSRATMPTSPPAK